MNNNLTEVKEIKKNNESMLKQIDFTFSQNIKNMKENRVLKEYITYYKEISNKQLNERDDFIETILLKSEENKKEVYII